MSGPDLPAPSAPALSNLQLRLISGLILAIVALAGTWAGGVWFQVFCVAIGVTMFVEWALITREAADPRHQIASAVLFTAVLVAALAGWLTPLAALAAGSAACLVAGLITGRWAWALAGFVYAGFSALALAAIRGSDQEGLHAIVILFAVVWATDIMAYFVGRQFGGPKLAPSISPGKTWSGAVGGAFFGSLAGVIAAGFAGVGNLVQIALLSLVLSVVSQVGDLFESWVKRRFGVKDSSRIIPGHGGVLDRVDGLVAAAMALYLAGLVFSGGADRIGWMFASAAP